MFSYPGSVRSFSFSDLEDEHLDLISSSDLLYIGNWNLNEKGTELARDAFEFAKRSGAITYFDMGDPSTKARELKKLIEVLSSGCVDIVSVNENELMYLCSELGIKWKNLEDAANGVQEAIESRVDVHTKGFSFSKGKLVETFKVKSKFITGAGDVWNAGNIVGELLHFEDVERLCLANAVAASYLLHFPNRPDLNAIKEFLEKSLID